MLALELSVHRYIRHGWPGPASNFFFCSTTEQVNCKLTGQDFSRYAEPHTYDIIPRLLRPPAFSPPFCHTTHVHCRKLMKRPSNTGVLLVLVALHLGSADASAGWIVHGRNRAGGSRETQQPPPGRGTVVRPTSTAAAGLSGFGRPCLTLRGGSSSSSADDSVGAGGVGDSGGPARESGASGETAAGKDDCADAVGAAGLDEDLYSRQLYVMGKTAMAKMGKADVLISGMRFGSSAVRVECSK